MKNLKNRIAKFVESDAINSKRRKGKIGNYSQNKEIQILIVYVYSSITNDSDYLPDFALKKKCRWSMNSRQGNRYIKK